MNPQTGGDDIVQQLFRAYVPEIAAGTVEIRGVARDPGHRAALTVASNSSSVDPVAACVGDKGQTVKQVVRALGGEHLDIIRWSPSKEEFIANLLAPSRVLKISFDEERHEADVHLT